MASAMGRTEGSTWGVLPAIEYIRSIPCHHCWMQDAVMRLYFEKVQRKGAMMGPKKDWAAHYWRTIHRRRGRSPGQLTRFWERQRTLRNSLFTSGSWPALQANRWYGRKPRTEEKALTQQEFEEQVAAEQKEYSEIQVNDRLVLSPPESSALFLPEIKWEDKKFQEVCPESLMALLRASGRYAVVGLLRGHELVYYQEFGQWQGEWIMVTRRPTDRQYFIWKGYFGSCSGCDDVEARLNIEQGSIGEIWNFVSDYMPFMELSAARMKHAAKNFLLHQWMPNHLRTNDTDVRLQEVVDDVIGWVMLNEEVEPDFRHIIEVRNAELKRRLLEVYTPEKMMEQDHSVIDIDEENDRKLVQFKEREGQPQLTYVYVKDSSTPRRYLLRVPPTVRTCHEAVAWTFGLDPTEYKPVRET